MQHDVNDVLQRMKKRVGAISDLMLANNIGIPRATIASWKRRSSIPMEYIINFCEKNSCSLDWLISGSGKSLSIYSFNDINIDIDAFEMALIDSNDAVKIIYSHKNLLECGNTILLAYIKAINLISQVERLNNINRDEAVILVRRSYGLQDVSSRADELKKALKSFGMQEVPPEHGVSK